MNNKKYIALISAVLIIVMSFSTVAYGGDHDTPVIPIPSGSNTSEQASSSDGSGSDWVTPSADISGESSTNKETGIMKTGWVKDGNDWYYLKPGNGDMATGWIKSPGSGRWFYLRSNGAMATGWIKDNGKWYYLKPGNGDMATGWVYYKNTWYYMNKDGSMATGWVLYKNNWYYLNPNGDMRTSDLNYKGKVYHFNSSGACTNP